MKNKIKLLCIAFLVVIIIFSISACDNGDDGNENYLWLLTKHTVYTITDGVVGAISSETEQNWIIHRHTSNTDYEYKYTSGVQTIHYYRIGQNETYNSGNTTQNIVYHSASGLTESITTINSSGTTVLSYTIELQNEIDGVRTWKQTNNNTGEYSEFKIQNGKTLEYRRYHENGVLNLIVTYLTTDNSTILAKLPDFVIASQVYPYVPQNDYFPTVEVVLDSSSSITIRVKGFNSENEFFSQVDQRYERFNQSKI